MERNASPCQKREIGKRTQAKSEEPRLNGLGSLIRSTLNGTERELCQKRDIGKRTQAKSEEPRLNGLGSFSLSW